MSHIRAAVLTNIGGVARSVGLDPAPVLRWAGLDAAMLEDPECMVPAAAVSRVLEEAARLSGCDQFGLLMAESRSLGSLGPISLALAHEPRIDTVIGALVRHQRLFGDAFQIDSARIGEATFLTIAPAGSPLTRQGIELAIGLFSRCIAIILDRRWTPEAIHFVHSAPADLRIHARLFQCPITFGSDCNAIVFSREALAERTPGGDAELACHAERLLALILPPEALLSAADRTRRSLRRLLPDHRGTLVEVAREAGLTPRTLQRQLEREGYLFVDLLNEVRADLAQHYLASTHAMTEVALMLGYQNSCSFTRWFKAQFGMPPIEWRRAAQGAVYRPPTANANASDR